jgi:hypothetical protein
LQERRKRKFEARLTPKRPCQHYTEKHHQMNGYAKASQNIFIGEDEALLLQLGSDYGVEFMFCDFGEIPSLSTRMTSPPAASTACAPLRRAAAPTAPPSP